jgi:hypothetical protein
MATFSRNQERELNYEYKLNIIDNTDYSRVRTYLLFKIESEIKLSNIDNCEVELNYQHTFYDKRAQLNE